MLNDDDNDNDNDGTRRSQLRFTNQLPLPPRYVLLVVYFRTQEAEEQDQEEKRSITSRSPISPSHYNRVSIMLDSPAHIIQEQVGKHNTRHRLYSMYDPDLTWLYLY
jgi:hypothetical protein